MRRYLDRHGAGCRLTYRKIACDGRPQNCDEKGPPTCTLPWKTLGVNLGKIAHLFLLHLGLQRESVHQQDAQPLNQGVVQLVLDLKQRLQRMPWMAVENGDGACRKHSHVGHP